MLAQVEVCTAMNTFYLFETKRHFKLNIGSCICIVSQLLMVMVTIFCIAQAHCLMPFQASLFPFLEPIHLFARANKKLHFHLFELAHTEDELTSNDFITERFTDLSNTERHFHTTSLLYIQEVNEDTLCRFRTQINFHCAISC